MKIGKKILPLLVFAMVACDDIPCDHEVSDQVDESFIGIWYDDEMNEEFRVFENGTFYDRYSNTMLCAETEGRWSYDRENRRFTETYEYTGQSRFVDWNIVEMSQFKFIIQSDENGTNSLEKVVESYELEPGQQKQLLFEEVYPEHEVLSYSSTNDGIAGVSQDGTVIANGAKGTAYIRIETTDFDVWAKVLVGDDCLDLWYNYESLIGCDYKGLNDILGKPSINGEDGYSFGYLLSIHEVVAEVDVFLDLTNGKANMVGIVLRDDYPESAILSYMDSHYYIQSDLGELYYSDKQSVMDSNVILVYDKENGMIIIYDISYFLIPDYTYTFGRTIQQIIDEFGEFNYDLPLYLLDNYMITSVYFAADATNGKVNLFILFLSDDSNEKLVHSLLSKDYKNLKTSNGEYGYYNANTIADATICAVYAPVDKMIMFYDLTTFGK